jgi:hypothetical protein
MMADQPSAEESDCQQAAGPANPAAACEASTTAAVGNDTASVGGGTLTTAEAALPASEAAAHPTQPQQPTAFTRPVQPLPPAAADSQPQPCPSPTTPCGSKTSAGDAGLQATELTTEATQQVRYCHSGVRETEGSYCLHAIRPSNSSACLKNAANRLMLLSLPWSFTGSSGMQPRRQPRAGRERPAVASSRHACPLAEAAAGSGVLSGHPVLAQSAAGRRSVAGSLQS